MLKQLADFIRTLVRPIVTIGANAVVWNLVLQHEAVSLEFWAFAGGMNAWWFYDRYKQKSKIV